MGKFNWAHAAKRDYIARHGSISTGGHASGDLDVLERKDVALRARLQAHVKIIHEYARLRPADQQARYELFFRKLCARFDDERERVRGDDGRLIDAINEYESGLLALLKSIRPRPGAQ
jgi:hypothetical protein